MLRWRGAADREAAELPDHHVPALSGPRGRSTANDRRQTCATWGSGNKGMRRFAIEPALLPLLRTMRAEANGEAPVVTMREQSGGAEIARVSEQAKQLSEATSGSRED